MRVHKPRVVDPRLDHQRVWGEDMGIATPRTIGKRTRELAHDKAQGGKPPLLTGSWADGSAGVNLGQILHDAGIINHAGDLGETPTDPSAYENVGFFSQLASDTPSTTDTVNFSPIIAGAIQFVTGVWVARILCEASFTNSAGTINNLRLVETSTNTVMTTGTPTTQTTRERYSLAWNMLNIIAPTILTFQYEYKVSAASTGTARAPWMAIFWARTS
jgi:hypothetical protein